MNYIQSGNAPKPVPTPVKPIPVACATTGGTLYSDGRIHKDNFLVSTFIFIAMISIAIFALIYAIINFKRK
jgi:hypothetical protein